MATQLPALSAGRHAPLHHFDGQIHSVFRRACNLYTTGRQLVTLLDAQQANQPQGIRLETLPNFSFEQRLRPGQSVLCRAGILSVPEAGFATDLRTATIWQINLSAHPVDMAQPAVRRAWQAAWSILHTGRPADGLASLAGEQFRPVIGFVPGENDSPLVQKAAPLITTILQATAALDVPAAIGGTSRLIGLGPGATPAGDDFLVGYLAGLWSTAAQHAQRLAFRDGFAAGVAQSAHRTNDISRAYLQYAAQGDVSEWLTRLIQAIGRGRGAEQVAQITRQAMAVGHTSGTDGVLGLLCGLRVWG